MSKNYKIFYVWIFIIIVGILRIQTAVTDDDKGDSHAQHKLKENSGKKLKGNWKTAISVKENPLKIPQYLKSPERSLITESLQTYEKKTIQNPKILEAYFGGNYLPLKSLESKHKTLNNKTKNRSLDPIDFQQNLKFLATNSYQKLKAFKNLKLNIYHRRSKPDFTYFKLSKLNFESINENENSGYNGKVNIFQKYMHQDPFFTNQNLKSSLHLNFSSFTKKSRLFATEKIQKLKRITNPAMTILEPNVTDFFQEKLLKPSSPAKNTNAKILSPRQNLKLFSQLKKFQSIKGEKYSLSLGIIPYPRTDLNSVARGTANSWLINQNSQHNLANFQQLHFTDTRKSKQNRFKNTKNIQDIHLDYANFSLATRNSKSKVKNLKEFLSLHRNPPDVSYNTSYSLLHALQKNVIYNRKNLGQKPTDSKESQPFLNFRSANCSLMNFKRVVSSFRKHDQRSSNGETEKQPMVESNSIKGSGKQSSKKAKSRKNWKGIKGNMENLIERGRPRGPSTGIQCSGLKWQRFKSVLEKRSRSECGRHNSKSSQIWRKEKHSRRICQRFKSKKEHSKDKSFKQTSELPSFIENSKRSKRDVENPYEETRLELSEQLRTRDRFQNYDIFQKDHTTPQNLKPIFQVLQEKLKISQLKLLERFIKIRTLLLFGPREILKTALDIFDWNYPPLLLISKLNEWQLRDHYDSNILSVVFLKETFNDSVEILEILAQSLFRWHMKKILFLVPQEQLYEDLFKWCHSRGFWNSLFVDHKGNSRFFDHLSSEITENISLEEFLKQSINWQDLKGYKIRCLMANNPPRGYIFYDSQGNIDYRGYYGTVLSIFAKHYNASLVPVILSDLATYRELDCVNYLQENVVDVCGDALTFGKSYAITNSEELSSSTLMVPYGKPLPKFLYFFKPFHINVWLIVVTSALYKIITLAFIHRVQHGTWNTSLQILYATVSVMHLPFNLTRVKGKYRRFLEIVLITVGFVVTNWYLAVLSSLLFSRLYHQGIDSLEDLKRYNISIMVNEFEYYQFQLSQHDPIIIEQSLLVTTDVLHEHRRNLDDNFAYYNQYDKIDLYLYQQKYLQRPRMKALLNAQPMNSVLGGIPMQTNWPFEHLLNRIIRHVMDNGLYLKIIEDGMIDGIHRGDIQYFPTERHMVEPLSIEYFHMPAMLLAVGYTLALGGFLLEMLLFKMKTGGLNKMSMLEIFLRKIKKK